MLPQEYSFPDNWIDVHDPGVEVGRIQTFGSWSPYLVNEGRTCLGLGDAPVLSRASIAAAAERRRGGK